MFVCDCPPDDCAAKVQRYLSGDRAAGDELATKFGGLVRRIVQRVLGPARREEWDERRPGDLPAFANLHRWDIAVRSASGRRSSPVAAIDFTRMPSPMEPLPDGEVADPRPQSVPCALNRSSAPCHGFRTSGGSSGDCGCKAARDDIAHEAGRSVRIVHYYCRDAPPTPRGHGD
jgi:hypothetical protein